MAFKTITTVSTDPDLDNSIIEAAVTLAHAEDGHLDVICLGLDRTTPGFYYAGAHAVTVQNNMAEAEKDAHNVEVEMIRRLEQRDFNWSTRAMATQNLGLAQFLGYNMRLSDVAVLPAPYGEDRGHEAEVILESALYDAGVPTLVVPGGATFLPEPSRVTVAWNDSREALRAIHAAMPILQRAGLVNIAIIDPAPHAPDRSDPGGMLSQMLSRHGIHAEVSVLARTTSRVADVISRHAADKNSELIVMGAYGHSRFREAVIGGATRDMLEIADRPVFMAH